MDGEIGVHSVQGEGSTFWFTARFEKQPQAMRCQLSVAPPLDGRRVLVVDDRATNLKILHRHLTSWGIHVETARNAHLALTALHTAASAGRPFDIAIIDQQAETDAGHLTRMIEADPRLASISVIAMARL